VSPKFPEICAEQGNDTARRNLDSLDRATRLSLGYQFGSRGRNFWIAAGPPKRAYIVNMMPAYDGPTLLNSPAR
jgi:hypothetical protein